LSRRVQGFLGKSGPHLHRQSWSGPDDHRFRCRHDPGITRPFGAESGFVWGTTLGSSGGRAQVRLGIALQGE
jgi:hypothetical protein